MRPKWQLFLLWLFVGPFVAAYLWASFGWMMLLEDD